MTLRLDHNIMRMRIENTVCSIYPHIESQIKSKPTYTWSESDLRKELISCILGSQVRYEMATTALDKIEQNGLLDDYWWRYKKPSFEIKIYNVLSGKLGNAKTKWSYRFPKIRANQIGEIRNILATKGLSGRLSSIDDSKELRQQLIHDFPGVGPKQASMFLRNIGKSYDLAVLDSHVIRFMDIQNLLNGQKVKLNGTKNYEKTECIATNYAHRFGFKVGFLDWAIWITMRAAMELGI
jgi:N-glycosylase/DNA lyase